MESSSHFGIPPLAFAWMAFAIDAAGRLTSSLAHDLSDLATGDIAAHPTPRAAWTTAHSVALELEAASLRDFSTGQGSPTLICPPLALHGATIADFAPDHSLVATLQKAGLSRLFVIDWHSATPAMRFRTLDSYFADLNVMVDQISPPIDLIGLCQGGWMALAYAARFPRKIRKLVMVGAPVDIGAGESTVSRLAATVPDAVFEELVAFGDGILLGRRALQYWSAEPLDSNVIARTLQIDEGQIDEGQINKGQTDAAAETLPRPEIEARFERWFRDTLDLPGAYYLETVRRIFKQNELAANALKVLGVRLDLSRFTAPVFLLAADADAFVAPEQLLAAAHLVGTPPARIRRLTVEGDHVSLFMGRRILDQTWPIIARWLRAGRRQPLTRT
jgi:poly(3-hydroxybutyrate) depolymerase